MGEGRKKSTRKMLRRKSQKQLKNRTKKRIEAAKK